MVSSANFNSLRVNFRVSILRGVSKNYGCSDEMHEKSHECIHSKITGTNAAHIFYWNSLLARLNNYHKAWKIRKKEKEHEEEKEENHIGKLLWKDPKMKCVF